VFTKTAAFYDAIYDARGKDYGAEARWIGNRIETLVGKTGARLLDVACGTGRHLSALRSAFTIEGLDADASMIEVARKRLPDVPLHVARMQDFHLADTFDAIVCLFGSIAYAADVDELRATCANAWRHLEPGGVFVVEPWLQPQNWRDHHLDAVYVDEPKLKIARIGRSERRGETALVQLAYLVGEPDGVASFNEVHVLQLWSDEVYRDALRDAGFEVRAERSDLLPRGLYVATKPKA
jgi:ubiquinone/menaquinone biosynthesis C-methylase UbiE